MSSSSAGSSNGININRRNPNLFIDLNSPSIDPNQQQQQLEYIPSKLSKSPTTIPNTTSSHSNDHSNHNHNHNNNNNNNIIRSRSPSKSNSQSSAGGGLLPTPDSLSLPSPSNPFQFHYFPHSPADSPTSSSSSSSSSQYIYDNLSYKYKKWIRKIMRRNFQPTPLGYTILLFLTITVFYTFSKPSGSSNILPWKSSSTSSSNTIDELPYLDTIDEDGEIPSPDSEFIDSQIDKPNLPSLSSIYSSYLPSLTLPSIFLDKPELYLLSIKLTQFLNRPILNHDEAKEKNYEGCPRELSDKLVNPDQYNGDSQFWIENVDTKEIVKRRYSVIKWLQDKLRNGEEIIGKRDGSTGKGRGIVLTGGNQDTTLRTITAIKHLRRLGVNLPIEVFHYSDELNNQDQRDEIEALGATLREAKGLEKVAGVWKNWQIKGLALVQSSFLEILYLDSDNVPLRSPIHLFDSPLYKSTGQAVFWPDLSKDHPDNAIWRIIGESCSMDLWTFESGQILINKSGNQGLNLVSLIISSEMMNEREFWFKMCGGDKDTFRWAMRILDLDFGTSPRWMSALGIRNGYEGDRFCGHSVLQYDLDIPKGFTRPPPLFVHSNLLKHLGGSGLSKGSLFSHIRRMSNDYYSNPSLNYAHSWVYMGEARGMCLDLDWHEHTPDETKTNEWPETISVEEEEGGVFDGFEDAWFDEGGRIGGW